MIIEKVNSEKFLQLNNKYVIYILGLLWADGHVTFANNNSKTLIIKHSSKEEDNFDFLNILLESGNWNTFKSKNVGSYTKKENYICVNWTSNRKLGEFLIEHDYRNKIKSPDKILNKINNDLKHFWFRGFFDGDGSITVIPKGHHSITFTGHKNQNWNFIEILYEKLNILNYKKRIIKSRGGYSSQIRISNKKDMIKLFNYLYKNDNTICLNRKYEKFKLL